MCADNHSPLISISLMRLNRQDWIHLFFSSFFHQKLYEMHVAVQSFYVCPFYLRIFSVNILGFLTLFHSFNKCVDLNILHLDDVICHKNKRYRISHDLLKNLNMRKFDSKYTLRCWYHWSYKINSIQLNILLLFYSQQTKYSLTMYGNANAWVHWNLSFSHRHLTIMRTPCVRTRTRWLFKSSDIMWHEKKNMQEKRSFINLISRCKSHAYLQKRWKDLSVCVCVKLDIFNALRVTFIWRNCMALGAFWSYFIPEKNRIS